MRLFWVLAALTLGTPAAAEPRHGIAMHGEPKYAADFSHLDYVNPRAPKGGRLVFGVQGSFDSLNDMIVKGNPAAGMREYVFESLMARSYDEPFSLYGLLAETVDTPEDRSAVTFTLRPEARFSDGMPVTADDVIFSYALLRDHGRPNHRLYYRKVAAAEKVGDRGVKFVFDADGDREMPLIMGLMPILPRHHFSPDSFEKTTLAPLIGSGPYVVAEVDPGSRVVFQRNPDYWGRDLPVNRGLHNFDELRYDYYRDASSMFEAFKSGLYDIHGESDPGRWARAYDFPAVRDGRVIKASFDIGTPSGMLGLVFNTRRPIFADQRVREALTLMFDFEWLNRNLYHGLYQRTESYFDRSELSAHDRPADARERELLAPFADAVRPSAMAGTFRQPVSDGTGRNRANRREALRLLEAAGYRLRDGKLVDNVDGRPFAFEILAASREQERLLLSYARALERIGITVTIRQMDSAQYWSRKTTFDFDMIQNHWTASLSPGNEQGQRWSSAYADVEGSFNYAGVKNPAVDAMIAALLAAESRVDFVSAVRALDRVLVSGCYVVPLFHLPQQWVAYWRQLGHPQTSTLYGYRVETWWQREGTGQHSGG